jgi:hypothetical protein
MVNVQPRMTAVGRTAANGAASTLLGTHLFVPLDCDPVLLPEMPCRLVVAIFLSPPSAGGF